jgi:hypothetical protein
VKRPGDLVQRRYSPDVTIRSTTSATPVDSSSSIAVTAVNPINRLVITAYAGVGHSAGGVDIIFQIRRDTTDITPGGLTRLSALRPAGTADVAGLAMSVDDTGHGGGSITYRLYWWTASGTAYLGRSGGSAATTVPSVVWSADEIMA